MQECLLYFMEHYGYFAVAFLIAIENICPPIPSEVILTFGGFMTTYTSSNIWLVIVSATIGSAIGALVLYGVGRLIKTERLERWLSGKAGKILHLKPSDVQKAQGWFLKKGAGAVFFCRFIPIVRSFISIPAGISSMNLGLFVAFTAAGTFIWNVVLVWLGALAGASWEKIAGYIGIYAAVALVVVILVICMLVFWFYHKRIKKKADK